MRVTGHSPQAVFDAMFECVKSKRMKAQEYEEGRDWQKYAERTANYAFSVAGDMVLRKHEKYHEHCYLIEHGKLQEESKQQGHTQAPTPRMRM